MIHDASGITVLHAALFHVHLLFAGMILVGGILFMHWALRALEPRRLLRLALALLAAGTVLMLLTVPFCLVLPALLRP